MALLRRTKSADESLVRALSADVTQTNAGLVLLTRCRPGMCSAAIRLTNWREIGILQSSPGWRGPHAVRSAEASRVHHAARQRDGVAGFGAGAAVHDPSDWFPKPKIARGGGAGECGVPRGS